MHALDQTLMAEWQELDIAYPEWVSMIVLDEVYYTLTMILVCATCFEVGVIIGILVTVV
jgi:hypothetical protein